MKAIFKPTQAQNRTVDAFLDKADLSNHKLCPTCNRAIDLIVLTRNSDFVPMNLYGGLSRVNPYETITVALKYKCNSWHTKTTQFTLENKVKEEEKHFGCADNIRFRNLIFADGKVMREETSFWRN